MNYDDTFKANHTPDNTPPRTEIEARIVAWVLGEASPFEAAELERLCAAQPELAVFKNRISAVHGLVATAAKPVDATLRLSDDRRAKLLTVISSEKVEGDLRAPSKPSPQPVPQFESQSDSASIKHATADALPESSSKSPPQRTPNPPRKSKVVAFASTMRQWALPIAACFALLLLVSATFVPTFHKTSRKAAFKLEPSLKAPITESEDQFLIVDTPPTFGGRPELGRSALTDSGANVAGLDPANAVVASNGIFLGQKKDWFYDAPQAAQQSRAMGGTALPAAAKTEDALRIEEISSADASAAGRSRGFGSGSGYVTGSTSTASMPASPALAFSDNMSSANAVSFAPPLTSRSLEIGSSTTRDRRANEAGKDMAEAHDQLKAAAKMNAKGRSQYLAGDSDGAQETFRQVEVNNPTNTEAKSFLARIANEKAEIGELKRPKARSEMTEEVSSAWQRPVVYSESAPAPAPGEVKPPSLAGNLKLNGAAGVTITAGVPQTFEAVELIPKKAKLMERDENIARATRADQAAAMLSTVRGDAENKHAERAVADERRLSQISTSPDLISPPSARVIPSASQEIDTLYFPVSRNVVSKFLEAKDLSPEQTNEALTVFFDKAGVRSETVPGARIVYDGTALVVTQSSRNLERIRNILHIYEEPKIIDSLRAELAAKDEAMSTFSLHVSDASYRLAKDALSKGLMPNPDTIRPEEFYNAFDYGDPAPVAGEPVAARIEQSAHPFMQQRNLVRIAMRVPAAGRSASQPLRLTIMLDTSGSMEREDRAATVRAALVSLTSLLGPNDRVTLIGFARTPRLIAENVAGDKAATLLEAAAKTPSEGGTNLEEALRLAETQALRQFTDGAQNRIVLLTDGATNLGDADPVSLATRIEKLRQRGVAFDACGIVAEGLNDNVLESLTRKGDGRYSIINSPEDADANFARQLAGAFRPAAKDVKVQVHFNPARVGRYRLIGFEQHRLKTEDFRNDAVDAAELASEEAATAIYQVEVLPQGEGELGEVSVRFLDTNTGQRVERSWTIAYDAKPAAFAKASPSIQLAGSAAFLAEKLRGGELAAQFRLADFAPVVNGLTTAYPNSAPVKGFVSTFQQARRITGD